MKKVAAKLQKDDDSVSTIGDKVVVTREISGHTGSETSYVPKSLITSEVDNLRII